MKKWKAILFGTLLTLSLCTFTACGTEVNNADETVDAKKIQTKILPQKMKIWEKKQTMTV
mgnify:CR=1 FL=1